jgi:hypothetical protein
MLARMRTWAPKAGRCRAFLDVALPVQKQGKPSESTRCNSAPDLVNSFAGVASRLAEKPRG